MSERAIGRIKLIVGLVTFLLILLLFSPHGVLVAQAAVSEYNYTTGAGTNKWAYESIGVNDNPPPDITSGTEFTSYTEIDSSNDVRYTTTGGSATNNPFHRFEFDISEDPATITEIGYYWEGYGDISSSTLYIWNFTASDWESLGTHAETTTDGIVSGSITDTTKIQQDYINASGYLELCAVDIGNKPTLISTDYVYVNVTYTAPDTTPPSFHSPGLSGTEIPQGDPVELWINITDDTEVAASNFTVMYPNGTSYNFTASLKNGTTQSGYWNYTFDTTGQPLGTYNWTFAHANDTANNWNSTSVELKFNVTEAAYVAITVSPADVDFGIVNLGSTNQTTGDAINATNTGTATGDMQIKAFNTTDWTLTYANATGGLSGEQFFLNHNETGWWEPINLTYSSLASGVLAGDSRTFDLRIGVSPDTTITTEQTTNVTIRIVAV